MRWWKSTYDNWLCGLCHPPAAARLAVEWKDVDGVSDEILRSDIVDGGPRIPKADLLAMWHAVGRGQLDSVDFKKVLRRLAFRWDAQEKRWHYVTLTEEDGRGVTRR